MTTTFVDPSDGEILEGFLCPICREDLKSIEYLTSHVERSHSEEEDAIKSIFKDIFTKARNKIKINFDDTLDLARSGDRDREVWRSDVHPLQVAQSVGVDCSLTSYFISVRDPRTERYASETNQLIIRLNKLLTDRPTDPVLRKIHEQKTVLWIDGNLVKICPSCAKRFHIARRQHHCRLCGSVMCDDCSKFLALEDAMDVASIPSQALPAAAQQNQKDKDDYLNSIRTCDYCLHLLEARKEKLDSRNCRPPITVLYAAIEEYKKQIIPDLAMYSKIIDSLYDGESIFTLADASALRSKIGRIAELIESKSKAILAIPCVDGSREDALKKSIRLAAIQFIKDRMLTIPQLPVEEEIRKIQARRKMETEQRIERERRLASEAYEKYGLAAEVTHTNAYASASGVQSLDNWSAHQTSSPHTSNTSDPLVEQINIIKGYIKQARAAMRFDEVETLEINLRELQSEFYQRSQSAS